MAENEDGQEKTEEATPRRKQDAAEKGQIVRSRELTTLAMLFIAAAGLLAIFFLLFWLLKDERAYRPYLRSATVILFTGIFLNLCFYPDLLRYQSGNAVAAYMNKKLPGEPLGRIGIYFPSGEFYLNQPVYGTDVQSVATKKFTHANYLFITADEWRQLQDAGLQPEVITTFNEFHVTMLTLKFINPATRYKELKTTYLVKLP